jgi:hypothetical protein
MKHMAHIVLNKNRIKHWKKEIQTSQREVEEERTKGKT